MPGAGCMTAAVVIFLSASLTPYARLLATNAMVLARYCFPSWLLFWHPSNGVLTLAVRAKIEIHLPTTDHPLSMALDHSDTYEPHVILNLFVESRPKEKRANFRQKWEQDVSSSYS